MNKNLLHPRRNYEFKICNPFANTFQYLKFICCSATYQRPEIDQHIKTIMDIETSDVEDYLLDLYRSRFEESKERASNLTNKAAIIFSGTAIVVSVISSTVFQNATTQLSPIELVVLLLSLGCTVLSMAASFKAIKTKAYQTFGIDFGLENNTPHNTRNRHLKLLIFCIAQCDALGDELADYVNSALYFLIVSLIASSFFLIVRYSTVSNNYTPPNKPQTNFLNTTQTATIASHPSYIAPPADENKLYFPRRNYSTKK